MGAMAASLRGCCQCLRGLHFAVNQHLPTPKHWCRLPFWELEFVLGLVELFCLGQVILPFP